MAAAAAAAAVAATPAQQPRSSESDAVVAHNHQTGRAPPTDPPVLCVVYEDPNYIAIDKPADLRIDGDHKHTAEKMLAAAYPEHAAELRHCHQLDYATSGVMCYALSRRAASAAGWLFEHRHTRKVYLAILRGHLEAARMECELPIADDPSHSFKMMVGTDEVPGRPAQTVVHRLAKAMYRGQPVTKVELHPSSGRRHQLRVHCAAMGHPIVGDATYTDDTTSPRMMLHAWKLGLPLSKVPAKRLKGKQACNKRSRLSEKGDDVTASREGTLSASIPARDIAIESSDPLEALLT